MKKIIIKIIAIIVATIGLIIFFQPEETVAETDITVSTYPLYLITKEIVGDSLDVELIGENADPHSFEPTSQDIRTIENSKLFITNGNDLDEWTQDIETDTTTLVATDELDNGNQHIWLSPETALKLNNLLAKELGDRFEEFEYNNSLEQELTTLEQEYIAGLDQCTVESVIIPHNTLEELAGEFGFRVFEINPNEEGEPSGRDIASAIEYIQDNNINVLLDEIGHEEEFVETIENETGVQVLTFSNLENKNSLDHNDESTEYVDILRQNLATLKIALSCNQ